MTQALGIHRISAGIRCFIIGLLIVTLFLYAPHILVIDAVMGISWPNTARHRLWMPPPVAHHDHAGSQCCMHRISDPVLRFSVDTVPGLSSSGFVTILPVVTGYIAYHHLHRSAATDA